MTLNKKALERAIDTYFKNSGDSTINFGAFNDAITAYLAALTKSDPTDEDILTAIGIFDNSAKKGKSEREIMRDILRRDRLSTPSPASDPAPELKTPRDPEDDAIARDKPAPVGWWDSLPEYNAQILGDWGGGNVEWWHDYIRAELGYAHEFYAEQFADLAAAPEPPVSAPDHTDLMVSPESIDAFLEANPLPPESPVSDGWRDIASAPKDGTEIIAWSYYFSSAAPYRWDGKTWTASHEMTDVIEYQSDFGTTYKSDTTLTHWQPLPAAPKGRE